MIYHLETYDVTTVRADAEGDTTMDGEVQHKLTAETKDGTTTKTLTYNGSLEFSGGVIGSCSIEVTQVTVTAPSGNSVSYTGFLCGQNATTTLQ